MTAATVPSATTVTTGTTATPARTRTSNHTLVRPLALATLGAAAGTEVLTAIVRGAGVHLAINAPGGHGGTPIGFGACTIALLMIMVVGTGLAYAIRRYAARPARTWYAATTALVVVSFVPDLTESATSTATRLTLMAAHVVAAAIIVPAVGRRLR